MSEPANQAAPVASVAPATHKVACPHPEAVGTRYGDPISPERQADLQRLLDEWNVLGADHGSRKGPFGGTDVALSGADVFWLAGQVRDGVGHVEDLHLEGATLRVTQLEGAVLDGAHLAGAHLSGAHLEGATLYGAHLEGADLSGAHLQGAYLYRAEFDSTTDLRYVILCSPRSVIASVLQWPSYGPALGDIRWGGVDLTTVEWEQMQRLGDEEDAPFFELDASDHQDVVRAYRQLATQLRTQGMSEDADRYAYRAQVRKRGVLLRQLKLPQYVGSLLLAALAGYGYRPGRTLLIYLLMIAGFAATYFAYGTGCSVASPLDVLTVVRTAHVCVAHPMTWHEAIVVSVTAFHGRGFFASVFQPSDPQATIAAVEAVIGLLVEISFIATFTQRFFGAR